MEESEHEGRAHPPVPPGEEQEQRPAADQPPGGTTDPSPAAVPFGAEAAEPPLPDALAPDGEHPGGKLPRHQRVLVKWGTSRRKPLLLLAGVGLVDALDRGVLAGVLTAVQQDLGVNDFQMGLLDSTYIIMGLLFALPAGYLSDRTNRTRLISVIMVLWTVFTAGTAAVRTYWQMFLMRTVVGLGDTVDDPASQSLLADFYPARVRGRAYAYFRATPTVGRALGIVVGGGVGALLGWRAAFLVVAIPGLLLALGVWRLREPLRGESDLTKGGARRVTEPPPRRDTRVWHDVGQLLKIRSLRALVLGTAVGAGSLSGLAFWAVAYHERHSDMTPAVASGIVGALILFASLGGTITGGHLADRVRGKVRGAAMLGAGLSMGTGVILLAASFIEGLPVWGARIPLQVIAVALIVGALPATFAMTSEVVPAQLRGTGFSLVKVSSTVIGTAAPPLVGWISDQRTYVTTAGREVGDLGFAFSVTVPLVLIGAVLLIRGRHTVEEDKAPAEADMFGDLDEPETEAGPPT